MCRRRRFRPKLLLAATLSVVMTSSEEVAAGATAPEPSVASAAAAGNGSQPPKDEGAQTLPSRWSKRWSDNIIGWHKDDVHRVLLEHGHRVGIPGFFPAAGGSEKDDETSCAAAEKKEEKGCTSSPDDATNDGGSFFRVLVPLCGKTVDLAYLAKIEGVEVVGNEGVAQALDDFARGNPDLGVRLLPGQTRDEVGGGGNGSSAFERMQGDSITLLRGDYFDLNPSETGGRFDAVWDRAAMVAISPDLRERYVSILGGLVKPGGAVLLLAFDRRVGTAEAVSGGPPYSVNEEDVRKLFGEAEWVESLTLVAEYDEMENEDDRRRWSKKGLTEAYELLFVIKAKE